MKEQWNEIKYQLERMIDLGHWNSFFAGAMFLAAINNALSGHDFWAMLFLGLFVWHVYLARQKWDDSKWKM